MPIAELNLASFFSNSSSIKFSISLLNLSMCSILTILTPPRLVL